MSLIESIDKKIKELHKNKKGNSKKNKLVNQLKCNFLTNLKNNIPVLKTELLNSNIKLLNNFDVSEYDGIYGFGISCYFSIMPVNCVNNYDFYTIRISDHECNQLGNDNVCNIITLNGDFSINSVLKFKIWILINEYRKEYENC